MATGDTPMTHPATPAQASAGDAGLVKWLRMLADCFGGDGPVLHGPHDEEMLRDCASAIERLTRERDEALDKLHYCNGVADLAIRDRTALEASAEKMRVALGPLAGMDRQINKEDEPAAFAFGAWADERAVFAIGAECKITAGDLRRARAAIAEGGGA